MKTNPNTHLGLALAATLGFMVAGCGEPSEGDAHGPETDKSHETGENSHVHADGSTHDAHEEEAADDHDDHADHADHGDKVSLPSTLIANMQVELAQGHGAIKAGEESHLVVKLPYNDNGATVIRAWIGTEDRTLSFVGKGEYASSHDDYDIHAIAPDPLPENAMWWIEIENPDGSKGLGSATPIME